MKAVELHYTSKNIRDSITKNPATATERLDHIGKGEDIAEMKNQQNNDRRK